MTTVPTDYPSQPHSPTRPLTPTYTHGNAHVERIGDEVAIVDLSTHHIQTLNNAGAVLWDRLSTPADLEACAQTIVTTFGIDPKRAYFDAEVFVTDLLRRGLLVQVA